MTASRHLEQFGTRVRELRLIGGWSRQRDFADRVGLDRTYLSGIERGRRNPTLTVIVKLANGLGVAPAELFKNVGDAVEPHH